MSAGGAHHEHIVRLQATDESTGTVYDDTREVWHNWIAAGNSGYVKDALGDVISVRAVENAAGTRWVQTYADKTPKDNLLWLPLY